MRKGRTNSLHIRLSDLSLAITSNPGNCSCLAAGTRTGRNLSRNFLTGIGPTKYFLISESMLSRSSFSGWMVAANFVELLRVFFAGVLRTNVDMIGRGERGQKHIPSEVAFYRADSLMGQRRMKPSADDRGL